MLKEINHVMCVSDFFLLLISFTWLYSYGGTIIETKFRDYFDLLLNYEVHTIM